MVERPLPTNQRTDPLLGCKVLKKVPLCQVGDLVEWRGARACFERTEILEVGWGKKWKFVIPDLGVQSRCLKNSMPNSRRSPAACWRSTFAVMGGVSFGTSPDDAGEGVGMVRWTT